MHKAKCTDRSIYGAQVRLQYVLLITLPAATTTCHYLSAWPWAFNYIHAN